IARQPQVTQSEFQAGSHLGNVGSTNNREGTQMKMIWRACGLLGGLILFGSAAMAIETKPKQENWKMNIAVVNDGTKLVYFEHMDGAFLGSIYVSQQKAITAANFPFPTRGIGEMAFGANGKPGMSPGVAYVPGVIAFPGGLPIMTGSKAQ